jgi:hypothetical protein
LSPGGLPQWHAASHFEVEFSCVASRNAFVLFKKVDFITVAATGMALIEPRVFNLKYRKAGIPIVMEGAPRVFLCVIA